METEGTWWNYLDLTHTLLQRHLHSDCWSTLLFFGSVRCVLAWGKPDSNNSKKYKWISSIHSNAYFIRAQKLFLWLKINTFLSLWLPKCKHNTKLSQKMIIETVSPSSQECCNFSLLHWKSQIIPVVNREEGTLLQFLWILRPIVSSINEVKTCFLFLFKISKCQIVSLQLKKETSTCKQIE